MATITIKEIDNGFKCATFKTQFKLASGEKLKKMQLVYEELGVRNSKGNNTVLVMHSLAASQHLCSNPNNKQKGWWEELVGPYKAIDTNKLHVICINNIGSCFGSTGPASLNPAIQRAYRDDFPEISLEDIVRSQKELLDGLNIKKLHAIIGGSLGGTLVLVWGQLFPKYAQNLIPISMSHKSYPVQKAHRDAQRAAIYLDPRWEDGAYKVNPSQGLKVARMFSHMFYRSLAEVDTRFDQKIADLHNETSDIASYYHYNANKFAAQYDANSYVYLLNAMDNYNLEMYGDKLFNGISAKVTIISTDTDILYPSYQQEKVAQLLCKAGVQVEYIAHKSQFGHDAFLVDSKAMAKYIACSLQMVNNSCEEDVTS